MAVNGDRLFAETVLKAGFADEQQIRAGLPRVHRGGDGTPGARLPDVLLDQGALTAQQVEIALREMKVLLVTCPRCGKRRYISAEGSQESVCTRCRGAADAPAPASAPDDAAAGGSSALPIQLAHLRILRRIAGDRDHGVYKAFHTTLDHMVAVKLFSPGYVRAHAEAVHDTLAGARLAARLDHPNLIRLFHVGHQQGWRFVEMEFIEGLSLAQMLAANTVLPIESSVALLRQIGKALQALHEAGLIHGSVRPENILVRKGRQAKLAGFGRPGAPRPVVVPPDTAAADLAWLPPEAFLKEPLDARSDLYGLGLAFYRALTGHMPFETRNRIELMERLAWERPSDPCQLNPHIPRMLGDILLRALAKSPSGRFAGAAEFIAALDAAFAQKGGPRLGQVRGGEIQALHPLTGEPLLIGRGPECNIALNDERISRHHCRLFVTDREFHLGKQPGVEGATGGVDVQREVSVEDLESSNGTYVNGRKVTVHALAPGDAVRVGDSWFIYLVPGMPFERRPDGAVGWLHGRMPSGEAIELPVTTQPLLIGSAPECDVRIEGPGVTSLMGQISAGPNGVAFVNLAASPPHVSTLVDGSAVTFGPVRITFLQLRTAPVPTLGDASLTDVPVAPASSFQEEGLNALLLNEAERLDRLTPKSAKSAPHVLTPAGAPSVVRGCTLTARSGPLKGESFTVTAQPLIAGRGKDSGICLEDPVVSEAHARLIYQDGSTVIEDLDSDSGTFVNGRRAKRQSLKPGDLVAIGSSEFVVHL